MPHPDFACPTEYIHHEIITCQFCVMVCHSPTLPVLLSIATLRELPLVLCHDIKHPDCASPTEYSHRERITCQFCVMVCHTPTLPVLLSIATLRELPLVLCHDIKHPDCASPTEYSHRERITCQFCVMVCHTPTLPVLLSIATLRELPLVLCHDIKHPDFASPTEYSHHEIITCQFCVMVCHTPTLPVLLSITTLRELPARFVHDIKHPDLASPTEYSHRERITCQFCVMACHTPTLPVLLSTSTMR